MTKAVPADIKSVRAAGRRMYEAGLSAGALGVIGIRLASGAVAVTAAGSRLGFLEDDDLMMLNGQGLPSSENGASPPLDAGLVSAVLGAQPDAGAVIRTCSPYATALAHRGRRMLERAGDFFEHMGGISFVPYFRPGTAGLAGAVAEALRHNRVAIVEGQGPVVWGGDIDEAVDRAEALEAAAKVVFILDGGNGA